VSLARGKGIRCLVIAFVLALAAGGLAVVAHGQSVQRSKPVEPVKLPVVFPPVKKTEPRPQPTEQELRARAETGDVDAIKAYADFLPSPKDFPWYLKAAEGGNIEAMIIVAERANTEMNPNGKDQALSDEWSKKAIQRAKQAFSDKDFGVLALFLNSGGLLDAPTRSQYALAAGRAGGFEAEEMGLTVIRAFPAGPERAQLLQKCADDGHLWCTNGLAEEYLAGSDGRTIDHARAFDLYAKTVGQYNALINDTVLSPTEKIQWMKMFIEHGNINAVAPLSAAYCEGNGVPKSEQIATALLQALLERPDYPKSDALYQLAVMHLSGKCLPVNQQLFLKVINSASSLDVEDRERLADFTYNNANNNNDPRFPHLDGPTTLVILTSLAKNGPPFNGAVPLWEQYQASLRLGDIYCIGKLVKQSYMDAMTWYQQAEAIANGPTKDGFTNDGVAEANIAVLYSAGYGVPKDIDSAMLWNQKSVDHKNMWGEYDLAQLLMSGTPTKANIDHAISLYRASAEAGNGTAQNKLGVLLDDGKYLPQNYKEANGWFEKGFKNGNAWAARNLANSYQLGWGVDRDPAKAAELYQKVVDGGDVSASIDAAKVLANMYLIGDGIPKDVTKVFALYKKAADAGDAESEVAVGALYQMGQGVNKDLSETFGWFQKAAAQNYAASAAKAQLARLYRDAGVTAADNFNMAASLYEKVSAGQH
jgi:TPR repeat protein